MISKIGLQSFTSKVYISNYNELSDEQKQVIDSRDFLNEVKKLDNNGNKDIVVFSPDTDPMCSGIYMTLSKKQGAKFKTTSDGIDYSFEIPQKYEKLKQDLDKNIYCSEQKGQLVKYLI